MEKELELIKKEYYDLKEKLNSAKDEKTKNQIQDNLEKVKDKMRGKLLKFKKESQEKLKKAKNELQNKRDIVAKFAGSDVLKYKAKIIKEKDDLNLQITQGQKSLSEIGKIKEKIEELDEQIKLIDEVDKNQKALNNFHDSQKKIFEDYRKALDIKGLYFDYDKKDKAKEKKTEEKEGKNNTQKENLENKKEEKNPKEEKEKQNLENNQKSKAYNLDQTYIDFSNTNNSENKEPVNENKAYSNRILKNEMTLSFKAYMRLPHNAQKAYYMRMSEEEVNKMLTEIQDGLESGGIKPEEVINFRRISNSLLKVKLSQAKVINDKLMKKSYKTMVEKAPEDIDNSIFGIKEGIFNKIKFLGYLEGNNLAFDAGKVKLDLENPCDIEQLESSFKERYKVLYNKLVKNLEEKNIDINDETFSGSVEAKFIKGYELFEDNLLILNKLEDIDKKFAILGIDEKVCEEYRKTHVVLGDASDEKLLTAKKLLDIKPKFVDKMKSKIQGKKYFDKTRDGRFSKVINMFIRNEENDRIFKSKDDLNLSDNVEEKETLKDKFYNDLKSKTRSEEEINKSRKEKETKEKNKEINEKEDREDREDR